MVLRNIFLPDNKKFFLLFDKVADNLTKMSKVFAAAVENNEQQDEYLLQLTELEKDNDTITHKIFVELGKNFITPFDREDIHFLASGLDDIADDMLGVIRQMKSHKINKEDDTVRQIAMYNVTILNILSGVLQELRNTRALTALSTKCEQIHDVLTTADNIVEQSIHNMFARENDAIFIIRRMDHYEKLQQLLERIANVIHVIESVIIKYG